MNERNEADPFSRDMDRLLTETGRTDSEPTTPEYRGILDLARTLATSDWSSESRVRAVLRRRLLNRIDARQEARSNKPQVIKPNLLRRMGWVSLAAIMLLAFGAAAYAVDPAVSKLVQQMLGFKSAEQTRLMRQLNLSQTVNGVTVTLQQAYADANQIVVGIGIKGPGGQRYDPYSLKLSDEAGTVFPQMMGMGVNGSSDLLGIELPPGEGAEVVVFDAASVGGSPATLHLRLSVQAEKFVLPSDVSQPTIQTDSSGNVTVLVAPTPLSKTQENLVGPFTFEFTVPFIAGQTVQVQQPVEQSGVTVNLERVIITPSQTRAEFCLESQYKEIKQWALIGELKPDGSPSISGAETRLMNNIDGKSCHRVSFLANLAGRSGTWTMRVSELVGFDSSPGKHMRIKGPWVFRFRVQ